jgi:acyl dehydratase
MNIKERRGMYFEELPKQGKVMNHEKIYTHTLFRQYLYALITLNPALIHLSNKEARKQGFKGIIANGTHIEGAVMGVTVRNLTQRTIIANKKVTTENLKPVYIGERIRVKTEFGERSLSRSGKKGKVELIQYGYKGNQRKPAIIVTREVLFRRKPL